MRVLLIRPNSKWLVTYIPIGLGYLADAVRKLGHDVSILDARFERRDSEEVMRQIEEIQPDVVGISALHNTVEIEGTITLAEMLKQNKMRVPLILGGPLATTSGKYLVGRGLVDAALVGEGEIAFEKYLNFLEGEGRCDEVPGLIYASGEQVICNPVGESVKDLDDLTIAWDLLKPERYFKSSFSNFSMIKKSARCVPVFTSRGCPFGCSYCHNIFGKKFRTRSAENVLNEISMLKQRYRINELEIVDDCFNMDLDRAKAIARGIIERKLDVAISFPNGLRADRMDEELIDLLKQAGTYRVFYAVETASPRLQKLIGKNVNLERTQEIITYTARKGIMTCGFFMVGFPTETEDDMNLTLDYALRSKLHQAYFFYVNPFPGTPLAEQCFPDKPWQQGIQYMDYLGLHVNLSEVSDRFLQNFVRRAYRKFHFSPSRVWRTSVVVPKNMRTLQAMGILSLLSIRDWSNGLWVKR